MSEISPLVFPGITEKVKETYLLKIKTWNGLTLDNILEASSSVCEVEKDVIISNSRKHEAVRARTIFMIIARTLMKATTVDVGDFVRRDHSSVCAAQLRHNNWMSEKFRYSEYAYLYNKTFENCCKHVISNKLSDEYDPS